ncbi:hypothetical protein RR42_m0838 [Cupriavidus basilensis]|uniref:Uncharacterized protein n=1 Tax=Cupriavidus basilensis TaxID=68895 RepID=A0A0C4Y5J1_9BURK|nr:hypothetical protein RR42_m0838 [Cupriavidus basilensis]
MLLTLRLGGVGFSAARQCAGGCAMMARRCGKNNHGFAAGRPPVNVRRKAPAPPGPSSQALPGWDCATPACSRTGGSGRHRRRRPGTAHWRARPPDPRAAAGVLACRPGACIAHTATWIYLRVAGGKVPSCTVGWMQHGSRRIGATRHNYRHFASRFQIYSRLCVALRRNKTMPRQGRCCQASGPPAWAP